MPTAKIAPADGRIYALRDRTGTVSSIPLITGSILSQGNGKAVAFALDALQDRGTFFVEPAGPMNR